MTEDRCPICRWFAPEHQDGCKFAQLQADYNSSQQTVRELMKLNQLRLDDSLELTEQVRVAVTALDQIAIYVPDVPQSFEMSLEVVTDIADKAHVAITVAMNAFNNKPELAARAVELQTVRELREQVEATQNVAMKWREHYDATTMDLAKTSLERDELRSQLDRALSELARLLKAARSCVDFRGAQCHDDEEVEKLRSAVEALDAARAATDPAKEPA